jgi:hypothetical protein
VCLNFKYYAKENKLKSKSSRLIIQREVMAVYSNNYAEIVYTLVVS